MRWNENASFASFGGNSVSLKTVNEERWKEMQSILNKIKESMEDKVVELVWFAVKTAIVAAIVALLLLTVPIRIENGGRVRVYQGDRLWSVSSY